MLVTTGGDGERLERRHDLDHHPRVERATHHRRDVEVYGDEVGLVISVVAWSIGASCPSS